MDKDQEKKSLKDRMKGSLDSLKTAAKTVKVPEIKKPEINLSDLKIPPVKDLFQKKGTSQEDESAPLKITSISTRNALKVFYYMMAADGELFHGEEEKFDLIGQEVSPEFDTIRADVITECQRQLDKVIDTADYYDVLQDGVEDALLSSAKTPDSFITPKLLVWDLLTLAYSDKQYDETERRLLKYIVRKLDIDKAVFLEMESSIQTLMDLEKEQQWIKTTERPYLTIEAMVNEIEDRKHVIFDSVKALIAL
jgi:uncharacterized tellurite resistance protein B-like protein